MAVPLEKMLQKLGPGERAEVEALAKTLIEEELTLRDLRRAQNLTQVQLAEVLGIEQDNVSRLERRADMLLSTMSSYVQAMGGNLKLVAEFPDRSPVTIRLLDLLESTAPASKRARSSKTAVARGRRKSSG